MARTVAPDQRRPLQKPVRRRRVSVQMMSGGRGTALALALAVAMLVVCVRTGAQGLGDDDDGGGGPPRFLPASSRINSGLQNGEEFPTDELLVRSQTLSVAFNIDIADWDDAMLSVLPNATLGLGLNSTANSTADANPFVIACLDPRTEPSDYNAGALTLACTLPAFQHGMDYRFTARLPHGGPQLTSDDRVTYPPLPTLTRIEGCRSRTADDQMAFVRGQPPLRTPSRSAGTPLPSSSYASAPPAFSRELRALTRRPVLCAASALRFT
jgi:hypothetical protein